MLVEFHLTRGYSSELDLFIAQTVLQYLCLKKSIAASTAFLVSINCSEIAHGALKLSGLHERAPKTWDWSTLLQSSPKLHLVPSSFNPGKPYQSPYFVL